MRDSERYRQGALFIRLLLQLPREKSTKKNTKNVSFLACLTTSKVWRYGFGTGISRSTCCFTLRTQGTQLQRLHQIAPARFLRSWPCEALDDRRVAPLLEPPSSAPVMTYQCQKDLPTMEMTMLCSDMWIVDRYWYPYTNIDYCNRYT